MPFSETTNADVLSKIKAGRNRTNLLQKYEQNLIAFLVPRIPTMINSNHLTIIGLIGGATITLGFILAHYVDRNFLLLSIAGFTINWFGDSLDGRLAYFRDIPRKWFGFTLDITVDWLTFILIGLGYIAYSGILLGFCFLALYGWAMITALLRYRVTNQYTIDSGIFGPTEVRIILSAILLSEILWQGTLYFFNTIFYVSLFVVNILDSIKLLKSADAKDREEMQQNI